MPAKGSRKRTAPEPSAEPPAKRGRGRPPGSKNKPKKTPDSEKISQQKARTHPSRPRAARPIDESSDEDSESESQDQEIPPVTSDQKWDDLLLKAKDRYEAKYVPVLQRYWRKTAAKPHTAGFERLTKKTYEAEDEPGCPNPTYSKDWSHADEETFLNEYWRGTVYEEAIKRQTRSNQDAQHLVTMFKISLHEFGVDPLTLWTLNEDEFEVTGGRFEVEFKVGNETYPNPIWSRSFCDKLSQIMTHPIWTKRKQRHVFMLFAVKWAIKCRTDDRRPLSKDDVKLLRFIGCPITPRPEVPLKKTLKRLLKERYNAGETSTTEAELLRCIADNTEAHQTEPTSRYYRVTSDDLDAVIMGLDESELGVSCEIQYGLYQNRRTTHTYPSRAEVAELYRNAFLNIERGRMMDHKSDSDSRPPSELPLRIMGNSNTRRRANTEQDLPPSVARDHGQDTRGDQDVIAGDGDNTRSQNFGTGSNEQTNIDRSPPKDIRPPEREIGLASNASRPRTFEADEYVYIPPDNSSSDGEEPRRSDQRVRDEEPEGFEEGGDDLLPSTADDQHQASKSTSPIAQRTSRATEPLTHTGGEEASDNYQGHGNWGKDLNYSTPHQIFPPNTYGYQNPSEFSWGYPYGQYPPYPPMGPGYSSYQFAPNLPYRQCNEPPNPFSQSHQTPQTPQGQNNGGQQWGRRKKPKKSHEVEQASLCRVESDKGTAAPEIPKVSEGGGSQQKFHRELHHQGTQYEAFGRTTFAQAAAHIEPTVCGMCKLPGHEVVQCWAIRADGFTHGCAVCNSDEHETDKCQGFPKDVYQRIEILVKRRACLPPLKTAFWYTMMWKWAKNNPSVDVDHLFPWTTQFAIDFLNGERKSAVEEALINRRNNPDAESSEFVVDPATANWEKVKETYGGDPKNFFEKLRTAKGAVQEQRITNAIAQAQQVHDYVASERNDITSSSSQSGQTKSSAPRSSQWFRPFPKAVPRQLQSLRAGPSRPTSATTADTPREMSKQDRVNAAQEYPVLPLAVAEAAMADVQMDLPIKMEATDEIL